MTADLPDFDGFNYEIVVPPASPRLRAWVKVQEAERRLAMYHWAERLNDTGVVQRVLLDDCVSAFLLTFEAAIQYLKRQWPDGQFDRWLTAQPEYDVGFRGLRTLRHVEAHVERRPTPTSAIMIGGRDHDRSGGRTTTTVLRAWWLPDLQATDLQRGGGPLKIGELAEWNALAARADVDGMFDRGLRALAAICHRAESVI